MKTWEYKIINVRSENYSMDPRRAEELNRLGDEGWELVSITANNFAAAMVMAGQEDLVIGGGTSHIQKNIIAERGLKMPKGR